MKKKIKKQIKHYRRFRSFKRKGLSQRAERVKDKDPRLEKRGKAYLYAEESDEYWNVNDPNDDYYCRWDYIEPYEEEIEHYNLHHRLVEEIIRLPGSQFSDLETVEINLNNKTENPSEIISNNYLLLEKSLYEHIKTLQRIKTEEIADKAFYLKHAAGGRKNIEAVLAFSKRIHNIQTARAIMLFSPFWVRSPGLWKGGDNTSFIKHVFAKFVVPDYLHYEWIRTHESIRFKWLSWYIILGQGGSLRKASAWFHWRIPSQLQHQLLNLPSDLSPLQACFFAEIRRLGGSDRDAIRLLQNGNLVIDPTELDNDRYSDENYLSFWQSTIQWLIKYSEDISDVESNNIINWALHQYTETNRENWLIRRERQQAGELNTLQPNSSQLQQDLPPLQCFTMKGRGLQRVLNLSNEYYQLINQERTKPQMHYSWKNHGWDYEFEDTYIGWKIIELTSGEELHKEGQKMGHCVTGYSGRCIAGSSAIFSLRKYGERAVTIDVHPKSKIIVQARGKYNRNMNSLENELIAKWVKEVLRK